MTSRAEHIDELRKLLNLDVDCTIEVVADLPSPIPDAALGYATTDLWSHVEGAPHIDPVELGVDLEIGAWQRQAGVFRLRLAEGDELLEIRGPCKKLQDDTWWLDARTGTAHARVKRDGAGEVAVVLQPGRVRSLNLRQPVRPPSLEHMRGEDVKPWLAEYCATLSDSPLDLDRVAAVGLLLRHASLGAVGSEAQEMLRVARARRDEARRWLVSIPETTRARLVAEARELVESLVEAILELDRAEQSSLDTQRAAVRRICMERERLEGIEVVVGLGRDPAAPNSPSNATGGLMRALSLLDADANAHLAQIAAFELDHPLLASVSAMQPDAWWGTHWHEVKDL
jgi:hypothetical protein